MNHYSDFGMHDGGINTIEMEYEDIWKMLKSMSREDRRMLAYEMNLKGFNVSNIIPHYYHEAKAIHDIEFFAPKSKYPMDDGEGTYYNALKDILEDNSIVHIRFKLYRWLPRFINDWREGEVVKSYIGKRFKEDWPNRWYRILPGKTLAGERSRSLFIWQNEDTEVVYKMTECKNTKGVEEMTFEKTNKS